MEIDFRKSLWSKILQKNHYNFGFALEYIIEQSLYKISIFGIIYSPLLDNNKSKIIKSNPMEN